MSAHADIVAAKEKAAQKIRDALSELVSVCSPQDLSVDIRFLSTRRVSGSTIAEVFCDIKITI